MGWETQRLVHGLLREPQVGSWLRLLSPLEAVEAGGGEGAGLTPALRLQWQQSPPVCCHLRARPPLGGALAVHRAQLPVGWEEGGGPPNPVCGCSLPGAVEPCYLSGSKPDWLHVGMFPGFRPGVVPLQ